MKIKGSTKITGLIGYPVEHTLSPAMHNAAFARLGLDFVYVPFSVTPSLLGDAVGSLKALNVRGFNVTIPHKENVIRYLDAIVSDAKLTGAVNTVHNAGGKLTGYNTDTQGFILSLTRDARVNVEGKRVLLVGAGGIGRAIGIKLASMGIKRLVITDEKINKARILVDSIKKKAKNIDIRPVRSAAEEDVRESDILINATPVGMKKGEPCVISPRWLHSSLFVFDVVYNRKTELLKEAERRGLKVMGGLGMLVYQGALSFEIWTGEKAPLETMKKAVESIMKGKGD